jgi:isocitrate lyase
MEGNGNGANGNGTNGNGANNCDIDRNEAAQLEYSWSTGSRWKGIYRPYSAEDVLRMRGRLKIEYTLARCGAERLWHLLQTENYVPALGALTGNQALQQVAAGLKAIYVSGWQVAADANLADEMYPDQSLYPANSVPHVVRKINNAFRRADQIQMLDGNSHKTYWYAPIVADAEAGFGGPLNTFELMRGMIEAGAAGVHLEDQLASAKKCGHMGGKVLVPVREFTQKLVAARLAADICGAPTMLIARTDADAAKLITSDIDLWDRRFLTGERSEEGYFYFNGGIEAAIARGLAYAPYADMIWCETSKPCMEEAKAFAEAILSEFPGKLLAYNCSPSFNWGRHLKEKELAGFQRELAAMGYKFQFVTLAGFHALNLAMFDLAQGYRDNGMAGYSRLQESEFEREKTSGYAAVTHQRFVGTGYFDHLMEVISGGKSSVPALKGSTEEAQFDRVTPA